MKLCNLQLHTQHVPVVNFFFFDISESRRRFFLWCSPCVRMWTMKSGAVCADNWIVLPEDWGLYKYNQHYKWIGKDIAT